VIILRAIRNYGMPCPTGIIRSSLQMRKQNLSYHLLNMLDKCFVQRGPTGGTGTWQVTEAGSKFLDMNEKTVLRRGFITLENARFKYQIIREPEVPVD
jgi:RIO-like serine/threonine protein kinase